MLLVVLMVLVAPFGPRSAGGSHALVCLWSSSSSWSSSSLLSSLSALLLVVLLLSSSLLFGLPSWIVNVNFVCTLFHVVVAAVVVAYLLSWTYLFCWFVCFLWLPCSSVCCLCWNHCKEKFVSAPLVVWGWLCLVWLPHLIKHSLLIHVLVVGLFSLMS